MFRRSLSFTLMILMALGLGMFNPTSSTNRRLSQPGPGWKLPQPALPPAGDSPGAVPTLRGEEAVSRLKQDGSYDSLVQAMAAARYGVNWVDHPQLKRLSGAYEAQNPAQGFTSYFTPDGLYLMSAQGNGPGWMVQMKLSGIGYGDQLSKIGPGTPTVTNNRIELGRRKLDSVSSAPTALTEWYENQADGLEQGLTIKAAPAGQVEGEWLGVAYGLDTLLTPHLEVGGQGIDFIDRSGEQVLRYDHLVVRDATGRELTSQMELTDRQVLLKFDDRKAVYPVTIDPTFGQQSKLTALDGAASDQFGNSVAISGETAVVGAIFDDIGANSDQGSAYVFVRTGTTWSQQAKLTASDGAANDEFGLSVAINGETAVVGAHGDDIGGNGDQGSAYVFVRTGTTWSEQQKLTASDGVGDNEFGRSVAIQGETVVVGAVFGPGSSSGNQGAAYVFVRSGTIWSEQQKLTASDGRVNDFFGRSVGISGETVVVGSHGDDIGANSSQGSAYVFVRTGTTWSEQQKLTASDGRGSDFFGWSVAVNGETVVVGALFHQVGANSRQGSAYVFVRAGTTWTEQQELTASDGGGDNEFGIAVAINGETVVVGADGDNINQGSAYVFVRTGTSWSEQQKLTASDGAENDQFGFAVATNGETVVVGAVKGDIGANINQGSAYVFTCGAATRTWVQQAKNTASDGVANDNFGNSVAISGETVVVGAPFDDINGNFNQGSAYVFVRNGTTWSQQQKLTASDGVPNDLFGVSVAISGETVVVGAYQSDIGGNGDQGAAYIYVRAGTIWSQQQKLTASDGVASDYFGVSVGISGETVVAGVITPNFRGSAYVFVRAGTSWSQQQKLTASDGAMGDYFAASVAISGETVVVGAGSDDIGANNNQGSAYVFVRSGTTWSQQQKLIASDGVASDQFGVSVAISGETVVVGASSDTVGTNVFQGSAYVVVRTGTTWTQQQQLRASDGVMNAFFGNSVGIDGETVVVGAYNDRIGTNFAQGSSYVFVLDCVCPTMTAMVSGGGTICAGSSSTVTVTVSGGTAPYTVTLDNGGGTMTGTGPVFNFSVSPASTTTYSLKYGAGSGTCPITSSGSATVTITQPPTTANAGPDQLVCGTSPATLAANTPAVGSGSWSVMAGPSSSPSQFSNPADPTATFTPAGGFGTYLLQWTISNPPCTAATDTVAVTFDPCLERSFLLVADTGNNRIQKFDGNVWTDISATGAENGVAGFRLPEAVVADTTGTTLYVADTGNNRVLKSTDSGTSWTVIASSGAGLNPLQVRAPSGLALDLAGNLYISDTLNKRVVRLPDGNPGAAVVLASTGAGSGQVNEPQGLAVSQGNILYIADKTNSRILKIANCHTVAIANTGTNVATTGTGLNPGQVRAPQGVAVSNAGDLVVADTGNNRILQFAGGNAGLAITYGGTGSGIGGLAGQFRSPEGVVFAGFTTGIFAGGTTLVVGDTANNRIQGRFLPSGQWNLVGAPNGIGTGAGHFRAPSKIR